MSDERLFKHQNLTLLDVKAALESFLPRAEVKTFSLLSGGMSTSNYRVETNMGNYVLRIYPADNDHLQTEGMAYKYANPFKIVPKVLGCDSSKRNLVNSFMVMEYIEGFTLKDYVLKSAYFPTHIAGAVGSALSKLHNIKCENWEGLVPFQEAVPFLLKGRSGGF